MARSQETYNKKEVRNKKEKKRKDKAQKKLARKDQDKSSFDDMIAYVDVNGMITNTPPDPSQKKEEIDVDSIDISIPKSDDTAKNDPIRKGVVTFFNESKGFGFIRDMESRISVFVHANNLREQIVENNIVTFEVEKGPKGPVAKDVKVFKG